MEVRYQCDVHDYLEAQLAVLRRSVAFYILLVVAFVMIFLGTWQAYEDGLREGLPALAVGLFWIAWVTMFRVFWIRRDFGKHPNLALERMLRYGPDGLFTQTEASTGDYKWSVFTRVRETPHLFVIYTGARTFTIVPKRAFSPTQLQEFSELLRKNIPAR